MIWSTLSVSPRPPCHRKPGVLAGATPCTVALQNQATKVKLAMNIQNRFDAREVLVLAPIGMEPKFLVWNFIANSPARAGEGREQQQLPTNNRRSPRNCYRFIFSSAKRQALSLRILRMLRPPLLEFCSFVTEN